MITKVLMTFVATDSSLPCDFIGDVNLRVRHSITLLFCGMTLLAQKDDALVNVEIDLWAYRIRI